MNMRFKFLTLLAVPLLCAAPLALGQITFFDDFDRDTVGPDWTATGGTWIIDAENRLRGGTSNQILYYNGQQLNDSWEIVANVEFTSIDDHWQGFAFNVQDDAGIERSYLYRVRTRPGDVSHQFLEAQRDGGAFSFPTDMSASLGATGAHLGIDTVYTFRIGWDIDEPGQVEIFVSEGETLLYSSTGLFGTARDLTGVGFAGIYDSRSMATHDFSLTVIPEPATTGVLLLGGVFAAGLILRRRFGKPGAA